MKRRNSIITTFALCVLAIGAMAQTTPVTFVDGGFPEMCEAAAKNLKDPTPTLVTGSRLGIPPIDICTMAIEAPESTLDQRAGSLTNRGVLKFGQNDAAGAMADFDAAIQLQSTLGQAHANRGYVLASQKKWTEAIAAFDQAIEYGTDEMPRVYFNRAGAHEEAGHAREAYRDYLKASELLPDWEDPKRELARFTVRRR